MKYSSVSVSAGFQMSQSVPQNSKSTALNSDEKVRPFKSTAEDVSFERSHHRTMFTDSKVGSTFQ